MACIGSVLYDPATAATVSTASLLAMTAMDTTNARITFTAPASGNVLVRIRVGNKGATSLPMTLLGVLEGATVMGRQAPIVNRFLTTTTEPIQHESVFVVTGLGAGSHTWDAAYAVQVLLASTTFGWGGPNNTTASDAYGALIFEVWDAPNLLAGKLYDPATVATTTITTASAMTAIDTTNLRLTFTPPASGKVLVRLRCVGSGSTAMPTLMLGVLNGASVTGRACAFAAACGNSNSTDLRVYQSEFVVGGLAGSQTWDAAVGVETGVTSNALRWGGPDDAIGADAYGGFAYEVWAA